MSANHERLAELGFTNEELEMSTKKLDDLIDQVNSELGENVRFDNEVKAKLIELSMKFVEKSTEFGVKMAELKKTDSVQVDDLKLYVEGTLGMHVPGFYTGNEINSNGTRTAHALVRGDR